MPVRGGLLSSVLGLPSLFDYNYFQPIRSDIPSQGKVHLDWYDDCISENVSNGNGIALFTVLST